MSNWKPVDIIAAILSCVIGVVLIVWAIESACRGDDMTEAQSKIIGSIFTSLISIIALYVGETIRNGKDGT